MEQLLKNKKILMLALLVVLLIVTVCAFMFMKGSNDAVAPNTEEVQQENNTPNEDIYLRDENGNIKKALIIDNEEYKLTMDLYGTWKEYLLPSKERDKYQAFMIPNKTSDVVPEFYILIQKSPNVNSEDLVEEEIVYNLKNEFDSFELEQIQKKVDGKATKYTITYKTIKNRDENKNYLTIIYRDGYKISFTYSALSLAYASEKGYIDDMINTVNFEVK